VSVNYSLEDLLYLMRRLRDPQDGCPWDREQSLSSIVPHTIEESYELADAIGQGDFQQIKEELGDVLFQVVFYAQLAAEQEQFEFTDIVSGLVEKLLRRHPHVFPDGSLQSRVGQQSTDMQTIKKNWEVIKAAERQGKQQNGVLDDVPVTIPALSRAIKLQKRAAQVGFDWGSIEPVLAQLQAEIVELVEAKDELDEDQIEAELGDVLFCAVNLSRHLKKDPETALRRTNSKFEARFRYIETKLAEKGITPDTAELALMDALWDEAKTQGL
jgi:ATP diphosphatase